jgi:hypothetical protein
MLRKLSGILAGLAAGALLVAATEAVSGLLYPPPPGLDRNDLDAYRVFVARLPDAAFAVLLVGHALASLAAGAVAALVAGRKAVWPGVVAGALLCLGGVVNVIALPHPAWFVGADLACYLPLAWLGARAAIARLS